MMHENAQTKEAKKISSQFQPGLAIFKRIIKTTKTLFITTGALSEIRA